jgi:hypothetical protein
MSTLLNGFAVVVVILAVSACAREGASASVPGAGEPTLDEVRTEHPYLRA